MRRGGSTVALDPDLRSYRTLSSMVKRKKSDSMGSAECARRTGLTVRALRLYERHRLIEPRRTAQGWRCYGPEELRRLNVIVTLKTFGMSLAQISTLLGKNPPPLTHALQLQLRACGTRRDAAVKSMGLVKTALATIEAGKQLSLDDLCNLTRSMEMENSHALFQTVRAAMNENLTPEEERAVMTWLAARSQDEMKTMRECAPAARDLLRSFQGLREKNVDPAAPETQALVVQENDLAVRTGARNHMARLFEWNTTVALKWMKFGDRVMSKRLSSVSGTPEEGRAAYVRAAQVASPWHRALEPIADEAAALIDHRTRPSAAAAQALVERLRRTCADYSLGDPLVYARWARAILFRWPVEDNARKQTAWAFLANAFKADPNKRGDDDGAAEVIPPRPPETPPGGSSAFATRADDGNEVTPGVQNKVPYQARS